MRLDITPIEIEESTATLDSGPGLRTRLGLDKPGIERPDPVLTPDVHPGQGRGATDSRAQQRGRIDPQSDTAPGHRGVVDALESGRDLGDGLAQSPHVFPPMFISIVRVGENSGNLEGAFLQLTQYLELERDFRARLKQALRYPPWSLPPWSSPSPS
jgi:MSHA biogenesis protein MshG